MKCAIGLIGVTVGAVRYRRSWLFHRHGRLPVTALVRGTGTKRQDGHFRALAVLISAAWYLADQFSDDR